MMMKSSESSETKFSTVSTEGDTYYEAGTTVGALLQAPLPSAGLAEAGEEIVASHSLINGSRTMTTHEDQRVFSVKSTNNASGESHILHYSSVKVIGNGSFGVVFQAQLLPTHETVAIKKVLQDRRYKNRELQIMKVIRHPNIVTLLDYFYTSTEKNEVYLNLVLEFVPDTIYRTLRQYSKAKQTLPMFLVKLYMYELFRSLAYLHSLSICHRDIKPQNLLLDPTTGVLKLCDFGSAKLLIGGEPNVSYICSRYYRAPELIFGATCYTTAIDIWSAGCVMAELMLGQPLFPGESGVDQLVEIIKILGTPTKDQIIAMNQSYTEFKFPQIKPHPWHKVFRTSVSSDTTDLLSKLLEYAPGLRMTAIEALIHPFFDELRDPNAMLPDGQPLPVLFNFSLHELSIRPDLIGKLIPPHAEADLLKQGIDVHHFVPQSMSLTKESLES